MSVHAHSTHSPSTFRSTAIVGEPEVVEDAAPGRDQRRLAAPQGRGHRRSSACRCRTVRSPLRRDVAATTRGDDTHGEARALVAEIIAGIRALAPAFPHDAEYLAASVRDFERWADQGFGVPDFLDSLAAFQPQRHRVDGTRHLVVFPMYTQNGSRDRHVEAVLVEAIWPEFIARLEAGDYGNKLFVSLRFLDFTPGYDTNSAVLFPETIAMREIPTFTWGAIFQDREAARYRRVVRAAAEITKLDLPADAARMLDDQQLTEKTFVMWDMIHDRTHMRGDLPFDPFMIKQRMPYFLYSLEELRCDLTAFRESVAIEGRLAARIAAHGRDPRRRGRRDARARPTRAIRDPLRPHLPLPAHGLARAQLRRARRAVAVRLAAPARRAALDRHVAGDRLGRTSPARSSP